MNSCARNDKRDCVLPTRLKILAVLLVLLATPVHAYDCQMLPTFIDDAETQLRRAIRATDLEEGQSYARRAKNALDDVALAAMGCQCTLAYSEFDTAASKARRAQSTDDPDDFVYQLRAAVRAYNAGIDALQLCD